MTPTERRALYSPAVVEAWEWLDTYCRHWAVPGRDWQTLDNLGDDARAMAEAHLATLRPRPSQPPCRMDDIKHGRLQHKTHSHCCPADHSCFADRRPDTAPGAGCRMG